MRGYAESSLLASEWNGYIRQQPSLQNTSKDDGRKNIRLDLKMLRQIVDEWSAVTPL